MVFTNTNYEYELRSRIRDRRTSNSKSGSLGKIESHIFSRIVVAQFIGLCHGLYTEPDESGDYKLGYAVCSLVFW